jgi:hypothetical protein
VHVEPSSDAQQRYRAAIRKEVARSTHWRSAQETAQRLNRIQRGWAGYFRHGNPSRIFHKLRAWTHDRFRRWAWRKHGCRRALWQDYPDKKLQEVYGLWPLHPAW